jgi:hypothetical protein
MERLAATTLWISHTQLAPPLFASFHSSLDCLSPHLKARAQAHGHQTAANLAPYHSIEIYQYRRRRRRSVEQVTFSFD